MVYADVTPRWEEGLSMTLRAESHGNEMVVHESKPYQEVSDCLYAAYGTKWNGNAAAFNGSLFAEQDYVVRRLTPVECERLMGFPDDYTRIPTKRVTLVKAKPGDEGAFLDCYDEDTGEPIWRKRKVKEIPAEECPDTPRYKALGNSFAVPVIAWLGERIKALEEGAL